MISFLMGEEGLINLVTIYYLYCNYLSIINYLSNQVYEIKN